MIAAANGPRVESVFDGSLENAPEMVLSNNISIVLETSSPKPWEIYHERSPGDFTDVGSYESPDKCFYALTQKLMQLHSENQLDDAIESQRSFAKTEEMTPH